jgi:glycosyltransferase involved in cell wall biosynthesis
MKISVAICTWNRADLLEQTLTSLCALEQPDGVDWELLVVNNNSQDHTDDVIGAFRGRLPLVRLFEPTAGHSRARNCAIRHARGEWIVWTDDDVQVDARWLAEYVLAFQQHPSASFAAGTVIPWFEAPPPRWIERHLTELSGVVVRVDHGREMRPLKSGEGIFGANMAVRRDVAARMRFDEQLGRLKSALIGGDDTDFHLRLERAGYACLWVPRASVKHFVPRSRMTASYVGQWYRDAGRTFVRREGPQPGRKFAGVPLWLLRRYATEQIKRCLWRPGRGSRWLRAFREARLLGGAIRETRAMSHSRSVP